MLKRHALVKDANILKWFKRHPNVMVVSRLIGFYLFYIPCTYFYTETCMRFVAISRQELINSLPSVIQTEGVNPSPIFRSMLTVGLTPLLSQDEIDSWSEQARLTQPRTDMGLKREPIQDNDRQSVMLCDEWYIGFLSVSRRKTILKMMSTYGRDYHPILTTLFLEKLLHTLYHQRVCSP